MFTATVRITGAGRLDDFRERLRWLMVREEDAEDYTEHHADGVLEYRFTPKKGIPFPLLTSVSAEYPELQVEAEWDHNGVHGRALIENGRLVQDSAEPVGAMQLAVEVKDDGELILAMACASHDGAVIGYAATAQAHTYFRFCDGDLKLLDPEAPDEVLEEVAFAFVEEWIWYDEEEAALERARYASYGCPVRGANLKADKLKMLRDRDLRFSSLDESASAARAALCRQWLKPA